MKRYTWEIKLSDVDVDGVETRLYSKAGDDLDEETARKEMAVAARWTFDNRALLRLSAPSYVRANGSTVELVLSASLRTE